jgi:hypothetical protein
MNIGKALGIGGVDNVRDAIRIGASKTARTHCLLFIVLPAKSKTTDTPRRNSSLARGPIRLRHFEDALTKFFERPDLEAERIDPLILADHHCGERTPQLAGQRRLSCTRLSANK